jgi:hypothetical protein
MPILVQQDNPALLGALAYQTGSAEATARMAEELRRVGAHRDAMILEDQQRQRAARNAAPSFYERNSMGQPGDYSDGPEQGVRTFVNDDLRREQAQREQVYGNPPQQEARKSQADLFTKRAAAATDPDVKAANELIARRTLTGEKVDDGLMRLAGFKTPADVNAAADDHRRELESQQKAQIEREKIQSRETIEREKLGAKAAEGPKFTSAADANAHEVAWRLPAKAVAQRLKILAQPTPPIDPLTGRPDPNYAAAVSIQRMLDNVKGKSPAEIAQRARELEAAGADPRGLVKMKEHVADVYQRAGRVAEATAQLAQDAAQQVGAGKLDAAASLAHQKKFLGDALRKSGISVRDYADYLAEQERQRGLRSPGQAAPMTPAGAGRVPHGQYD